VIWRVEQYFESGLDEIKITVQQSVKILQVRPIKRFSQHGDSGYKVMK